MIRRRDYARHSPSSATERVQSMPRHKYAIGQIVKFFSVIGTRTSKTAEKSMYDNDFEITRLLPTMGADFQYRIKNAKTGQERVVAESEINLAEVR